MTKPATVELLATIVRGDVPAAGQLASVSVDAFCAAADEHGVLALVASSLARRPGVPEGLSAAARDRAYGRAAADLVCEAELQRVLEVLDRANVQPLLLKGGQLAYSHYPRPDLRPRLDTDILIPDHALERVHDALVGLGYQLRESVGEEMVMSQRWYSRTGGNGVLHALDVHWKIANPRLFANLLSFEELAATSMPLPALSSLARGLSAVHALFVACVHRVAHHFDDDCLIWLYDIHLIAAGFDPKDWRRFVDLAVSRQVAAICCTSLTQSVDRFGTPVPAFVLGSLVHGSGSREATAGYLAPGRRVIAAVVDDLRALPTWGLRWRLMREHLFPAPHYMREVYAPSSGAPLAVLYVRRVVRGASRWLGRR